MPGRKERAVRIRGVIAEYGLRRAMHLTAAQRLIDERRPTGLVAPTTKIMRGLLG